MNQTISSFESMWTYSNEIDGSFTEKEARAMYDVASKLPYDSVVVEIGSYLGRSSSLLGQIAIESGHELSCVDKFVTGHEDDDVESEFKSNMNRAVVSYQLIPWHSRRAARLFDDGEIDLLFIDGDHLENAVREDINRWFKKVKVGGWIFFHDYNSSWDGVKKAVDDLLSPELLKKLKVTDSIAYVQI